MPASGTEVRLADFSSCQFADSIRAASACTAGRPLQRAIRDRAVASALPMRNGVSAALANCHASHIAVAAFSGSSTLSYAAATLSLNHAMVFGQSCPIRSMVASPDGAPRPAWTAGQRRTWPASASSGFSRSEAEAAQRHRRGDPGPSPHACDQAHRTPDALDHQASYAIIPPCVDRAHSRRPSLPPSASWHPTSSRGPGPPAGAATARLDPDQVQGRTRPGSSPGRC